jgi:hypothetical protein
VGAKEDCIAASAAPAKRRKRPAPKFETVTDHICGWPYASPYVFLRKKRAPKKVVTKRARKPRKASDL